MKIRCSQNMNWRCEPTRQLYKRQAFQPETNKGVKVYGKIIVPKLRLRKRILLHWLGCPSGFFRGAGVCTRTAFFRRGTSVSFNNCHWCSRVSQLLYGHVQWRSGSTQTSWPNPAKWIDRVVLQSRGHRSDNPQGSSCKWWGGCLCRHWHWSPLRPRRCF